MEDTTDKDSKELEEVAADLGRAFAEFSKVAKEEGEKIDRLMDSNDN